MSRAVAGTFDAKQNADETAVNDGGNTFTNKANGTTTTTTANNRVMIIDTADTRPADKYRTVGDLRPSNTHHTDTQRHRKRYKRRSALCCATRTRLWLAID